MKQKDLLVIGLVAVVAAIFSFVISGAIFGTSKENLIKVPEVQPISSSFPSPSTDETYQAFYNDKALDPTQLIQIGGNNNTAPFQDGSSQ
jgi:hypothetical protein